MGPGARQDIAGPQAGLGVPGVDGGLSLGADPGKDLADGGCNAGGEPPWRGTEGLNLEEMPP